MRTNDDGTFEVDPSETITFTVTRTKPPCVADFAPDGWDSDAPVTEPDLSEEVKSCVAPKTLGVRCTLTLTVSFTPDSQGDSDGYVVDIRGANGGSAKDLFDAPPNINGAVYKFHVSEP